jgi:hypothetical protein
MTIAGLVGAALLAGLLGVVAEAVAGGTLKLPDWIAKWFGYAVFGFVLLTATVVIHTGRP